MLGVILSGYFKYFKSSSAGASAGISAEGQLQKHLEERFSGSSHCCDTDLQKIIEINRYAKLLLLDKKV